MRKNNTVQAFWIAIGSFFSYGVAIASGMLLSRYFSKEDYGTYRQVLYVYQTLLIIFTLGLPRAYSYFLARSEEAYSASLIKKITNLFYLLGSFFSLLLYLLAPFIADILNNPHLTVPLRIFSPVPFFLLPTMGLEGILAVYNKSKHIALYNLLTKSFILVCVALPVVIFKGGYINAIIGFVFASFASFLLANYLKAWIVKGKGRQKSIITYNEILQFAIPLLFASLWGGLYKSSINFYISRFFGPDLFAEFSNGAFQLPFIGMVVGATSTVLLPLFSKKSHLMADPVTEIMPIWKNVFEKTIKITYPLILFSFVFAKEIMMFLYGDKYESSGNYFRIILISNFFIVIAYSPLLIAIGATKFFNRVHMVGALIAILLQYVILKITGSTYWIVSSYILCQIGMILSMLIFVSRYFKVSLFKIIPLRAGVKIIVFCIADLFVIKLIVDNFFSVQHLIIKLFIAFFLFSVTFLIYIVIAKLDYIYLFNPIKKELKGLYNKLRIKN